MTHAPERPRRTPRPAAKPAANPAARSARAAKKPATDFEPVELRHRHDGWTPERQVAFIEALAECGCVDSACRRVGISTTAAYALRGQVRAQSFRLAWDMALDHAIQRLSDAAYSRAIHGVVQPIFYKGEQIGERRRYDERLTMFLLRYRNPERYGAWFDKCRFERAPDGAAITLSRRLDQVAADAYARDAGVPPPPPFHRFEPAMRYVSVEEQEAEQDRADAAREAAEDRLERVRGDAAFDEWLATGADSNADVPSTSATSAGD
jgi:hypothetical protein